MSESKYTDYGPGLLPQHAQLLAASAITSGVAVARGYRSLEKQAEALRLGFSAKQARTPALLIPIYNVTGDVALYQLRPDQPRVIDRKAVKYETPKGTRMVIDAPPGVRCLLGDPRIPLFITEGVRK